MIKINILNDNDNVRKFSVEGHAYSDEYGKDIVCASVSILVQTAVLSLHEIANIDIIYKIDDGWLSCEIPKHISEGQRKDANIIIETMLLGLKGIHEMYPEYIKFVDKEV